MQTCPGMLNARPGTENARPAFIQQSPYIHAHHIRHHIQHAHSVRPNMHTASDPTNSMRTCPEYE
eukprot:356637-Chlamydomonas_euryale.AAC.4